MSYLPLCDEYLHRQRLSDEFQKLTRVWSQIFHFKTLFFNYQGFPKGSFAGLPNLPNPAKKLLKFFISVTRNLAEKYSEEK